ncbi:MAG TPA: TonB-dependent receptor, partial [Rhizomicrobium sp.]
WLQAGLLSATSILALCPAAYAQAASDEVETVVVTGIRASLRTSQEIKQSSSGVVDAITAEDIGKFPDTNLAEAIQRIPGVTIDRLNGEGARVTVRGFGPEYNMVTLNGRSMPGAINANTQAATRSFDFANLASDGIAGITVTKTGRADVVSGGIGSTINIKTARPFDYPGFVAAGTAKVSFDTTNRVGDDYTPNFSGLVSDTFFGDKLGILLSGSYAARNSAVESATVSGWLDVQHLNDDGTLWNDLGTGVINSNNKNPQQRIWAPRGMGYGYQEDQRSRTNAQAVVQYRPQENITATLDFTYAMFKNHSVQHTFGLWYTYGPNFYHGVVNEHGTAIDVDTFADDMSYSTFDNHIRNELTSIGLNLEWEATDHLTVTFDAHHSLMMSGGDPRGNNTFGIQGQTPSIMTAGQTKYYRTGDQEIPQGWFDFVAPWTAGTLTTDTISPLFYQANNNVFNTKIDEARLDTVWTNTNKGLTSVQFGIQVKKMQTHAAAWNSFIGTGFYDAADAGMLPASVYRKIPTSGLLNSFSGGGSDLQIAPYYFEYDLADFVKYTMPKYSYGPSGIYPPSSPTNDDNIQEITKAVYGQANFDLDLFDRPFKMTAGIRYEAVDVTARSLQKIATAVSWDNPTEFHTIFADNAAFSKVQARNYEFLPNIDASYEVVDNLLIRSAYSKTITRSNLPSMVGTTSVGITPKPLASPANAGNPGLLPYESHNWDTTVEWYYGLDSYVSANYFSKDVVNFIANGITEESINGITDPYLGAQRNAAREALIAGGNPAPGDYDIFYQMVAMYGQPAFTGQPGDPLKIFTVQRPTNANKLNTHGFEFAWQHTFGESGFGLQASWSIPLGGAKFDPLGPDGQFVLAGLSKSYGVMAYYEKYGFQGRLAFTHRDAFLAGVGQPQNAYEPTYTAPYNQLDASAAYDLTDNISVVFDGINLTGEGIKQYGRYKEQFLGAYQGGARYELGVHVKF